MIIRYHCQKSKTNADAAGFAQLSNSIEKHSNSLVAAAKIAAAEQEKNCNQLRVSEINARIKFAVDAILHEIQRIKEEIASKRRSLMDS